MGLKFNPLTAQFDLTGSGGGGASYIDGEVATYNDLPLSSTTAPLNTAWLVRGSSGVWPFTKPGGVYVRTATGGTSRDADYTYAGIFPDVFSDSQFTLYDDADTSKNAKFQLSGITTGTTRTLTVPNGNATIAAAPVSQLQQFFSSQTYNVVEGLNVDIELQNSISSCAIVVVLPRLTTDGARNGDEILLRPTSLGSGSSYTLQRYVWTGGGYIGSTETITTMEAGQTYRLRLVGGVWTLLVTPNLASPPAIGGTTPAAATFTNLTANTRVNLPNTNGTTAGDLYRNANTLRYRDGTNAERLLLNASDNLANLSDTATARTNLGLGSAATRAIDNISDSDFRVSDNGDSTKKVALECSGISASTTRTLTIANRSGTVVVSDTSAGSGSDVVNNIVSLTQAEYNAIGSPDAATLYLITDP